ncbi:MAG: DUF58 domain-containing protein [Steroidobacteraceae bacterium]
MSERRARLPDLPARRRLGLRERIAARTERWSRRRQGAERWPSAITRRRLYILPTRAGLGFAVLLLGMLLAGLNYANSVALLVAFVLGGFMLVAMNLSHRNLLGLVLESLTLPPAFAGDSARLSLRLRNPSNLPRHAVRARVGGHEATLDTLPPGESGVVGLDLAAPRRGRHPVPRISLSTEYPFGLFRAWTWVHVTETLLVYPAAHGDRPPPLTASDHDSGTQGLAGGNDEWAGLRPFRDGDSPRQVAWKAYARGAPLLVKEYTGRSARTLRFDYETLTGLDREQRLEQLARWIVDAEASGARYGLTLGTLRFPEQRGAAHRHRCLEALALHV